MKFSHDGNKILVLYYKPEKQSRAKSKILDEEAGMAFNSDDSSQEERIPEIRFLTVLDSENMEIIFEGPFGLERDLNHFKQLNLIWGGHYIYAYDSKAENDFCQHKFFKIQVGKKRQNLIKPSFILDIDDDEEFPQNGHILFDDPQHNKIFALVVIEEKNADERNSVNN